MAKNPLGRGLSALLGEDASNTLPAGSEIDIDLISPNPQQPRTRFAEKAMDELALSIKANGIVQPIVVRKRGLRYEIIAGERRWRAAQRAGLKSIAAVIREVSDDKLLELALIENIQRQELNPIEEAAAYRKLIDKMGLTQEAVAERVGKERSLIATTLRLLKLPGDIQKLIASEKLSAGHGRALLMTDDPKVQRAVARAAVDRPLSVRETERAIRRERDRSPQTVDNKEISRTTKDPNVVAAETRLKRRLGTNVRIVSKNGISGTIEIEYYNAADLTRLFDELTKN